MNRKNLIMKVLVVFTIFISLGFNCISYAVTDAELNKARKKETWDEFRERYKTEIGKNNDKINLTEIDLERMIKGPTEEERKTNSYTASTDYGYLQDDARNRKETGNPIDDKKWNKAKEEARKLATKLDNAKTDENKKKYAKELQSKIAEMRGYNSEKTLNDSEALTWDQKARSTLVSLGETPINNFENQIDSEGNEYTPGESSNDKIFKWPTLANNDDSTDGTLKDMIEDGDEFLDSAEDTEKINADNLKKFTGNIYNILLEIGVGISVIIGLILGIKFMLSGVEEKAEVKKMLWVYVLGCIVTFGSFGIWKLVVTVLENL